MEVVCRMRQKVLAISMVFLMLFNVVGVAFAGASDITGHWANKQVKEYLDKGLIKGYADGSFKPDASINRAEFVTLVNSVYGFNLQSELNFTDVNAGDWYYKEICKAKAAGYISGYQGGKFLPLKQITREEVAVILSRLLKLPSEAGTDSLNKLKDGERVSNWSRAAVANILAGNYMVGYQDGTFKPGQPISRAEALVVLDRTIGQKNVAPAQQTVKSSSGGSSHSNGGITTAGELISAINGSGTTITLGSDINLGTTALDINRAVTINGGGYTLQGNVSINTPGVSLNSLNITRDLVLGAGIGEGDVNLNTVNVTGTTIVKGGGTNSVHVNDSVLATVIVNKNNGAVRIVVSGSTTVTEVQLETAARLEESNVNSDSGFRNVVIPESFQGSGDIEFVGSFETVNSRATNVRIQLPEGTDVATLVLNAAAQILGTGTVELAEINASGSTLDRRPQNLVLDITRGVSANVYGTDVTENYSSETNATLTSITAGQGSIKIGLDKYVAGIGINDFEVTAKVGSVVYELQKLDFDNVHNRITYSPLTLDGAILGQNLDITVKPAASSTKVTGQAVTDSVTVGTGFEGRLTDVQMAGIAGASIKFRSGIGTTTGEIYAQTVTDKYGYFSVAVPAGSYTGEISGTGYLTTFMIAVAPTDMFNVNQDETAFRSAGTNEVKIMLTWGETPRDEDSHLSGPLSDTTERFHTWYGDKVAEVNGVVYADLDWDDTESFGPETTTVRKLVYGKYNFYVHNYSQDAPLRDSGAQVRLFLGNNTVPDYTFNVPTGAGSELYWMVFSLDVDQNGKITVTEVNTMLGSVPELVDKSELLQVIAEASNLLNGVTVGDQVGNYPQQAVDQLNSAITAAQVVAADSGVTQDQVFSAVEKLGQEISIFADTIIRPVAPLLTQGSFGKEVLVSDAIEGATIRLYSLEYGDFTPVADTTSQVYSSTVPVGFGNLGAGTYAVTQTVYQVESQLSEPFKIFSGTDTQVGILNSKGLVGSDKVINMLMPEGIRTFKYDWTTEVPDSLYTFNSSPDYLASNLTAAVTDQVYSGCDTYVVRQIEDLGDNTIVTVRTLDGTTVGTTDIPVVLQPAKAVLFDASLDARLDSLKVGDVVTLYDLLDRDGNFSSITDGIVDYVVSSNTL